MNIFCFNFFVLGLMLVVRGDESSVRGRVVCHYNSEAHAYRGLGRMVPSDIEPSLCSHLIYDHAVLGEAGDIILMDDEFDIGQNGLANFAALRERNPHVIPMISVGSWDAGSATYSKVSSKQTLREAFASNAVAFVEKYNLSGVEVNWQCPGIRDDSTPQDKENFIYLLAELRAAFSSKSYLLSSPLSSYYIEPAYNVTGLNQYLDFYNIMAYSLHGSWDGFTGADGPLYPQENEPAYARMTVDATVNAWISAGAIPSKINLAIRSLGRAYTLGQTSNRGTGARIARAKYTSPFAGYVDTWNYNEICSDQKDNRAAWIIVNYNNSYVYGVKDDSLWIGYDDQATMYAKGAYAASKGLGGLMFRSLDSDDFNGYCGEKWPLLLAAIDGYQTN